MTIQKRDVTVKQLPDLSSVKQRRAFLREMQDCMNADRPRIVLDCSHVRHLDRPAIYLLLCCLEEAMKRHGDVKLGGLPSAALAVLERTGIDRLFAVYDTTDEAVNSFHRLSARAVSHSSARSHRGSESAD